MKHRHGAVWFAPVLSVLVAVLVAVVVAGVANAIPFSPSQKITIADPTAGTDSDYTAQYDVAKGDALFGYQATFTPPEFGVYKDADVPNGTYVGRLTSTSTLGLINQPCTTSLATVFDLMDASTDTSDTVVIADTFADVDGNTLPDGVDKYPEFLTRMFPGLTPRVRYFGMANVGGSPVSLNFVIFEPGSDLPGIGARDASWGYPSASVVNDNGDPGRVMAPSAITDFCSPLASTTTTYGVSKDNPATTDDESGKSISTNPAAGGTYTFRSVSVSVPDADDDNIQNDLDTCPFDKNTDVDTDGDGIDDVCDPTPNDAKMGDEDGDGFMNRGDNCPAVANADQTDKDADYIGDICDTAGAGGIGQGPDVADGTPVTTVVEAPVEITGGAPAESPTTAAPEESPTTLIATPAASPTKTVVASPTKTVVASPTTVATAVPATTGGGGLLEDEEGFPTWAFFLIGAAAVLLLASLGTAVTVTRRRNK